MAESKQAVYHQASFLGGEWSPIAQGRSDIEAYKMAMNVCLNGIVTEQGAWERRSGTEYLGPSIGRTYSKLLSFTTNDSTSLILEAGDSKLRFFQGTSRMTTNDDRTVSASSSSSGIVSLTLDTTHGWSVGDFIFVQLSTGAATDAALYLNRLMKIATVPTASTLTAKDDLGTAFTFNPAANVLNGCTIKRARQMTTSWSGTTVLPDLRLVQASTYAIILSKTVFPKSLSITSSGGVVTFGSIGSVNFQDGPYLASQASTAGVLEGGAVSATSGTITFTPASTTFDANDVGRFIRLLSQPAAWSSGTTYTYGQTVTYEGEWWVSIAAGTYASSNVGVIPGTLLTTGTSAVVVWAPAARAGRWAWGKISAQATTSCTVVLENTLDSTNGTAISEWRLGVFKIGQYPTCGAYHDGRLWLAGAVPNRIDVSEAATGDAGFAHFATTDAYGTVTDASAVGLELNFDEQQIIHWMVSDEKGVVVGTEGGEILISSSGGGITPFDRDAAKTTRYKCANVEPCRAGSTLMFVQLYLRDLIEYRLEAFSSRFIGETINLFAKHRSTTGIRDIVYQQTPTPVVWCRDGFGHLTGITYRRSATPDYLNPPLVTGLHRHEIGDDARLVASIRPATDPNLLGDLLYLCTYTPNTNYAAEADFNSGSDFAIEVLRPLFSELE